MPKLEILEGANLPDWRVIVERRSGFVRVVESKEYAPETEPRDPEHMHDYGQNVKPVCGFDLHGTLTPDQGFPLDSRPFPGVKDFMDRMASRGCCLHISSASLEDPDPDVVRARRAATWAWCATYGLPINYLCPNIQATVRLDDRGINIPIKPDWFAIAETAQKRLAETYYLGDDGVYARREDLTPVGELVESFPDLADTPRDRPRGFSTPEIDIDIHRTINPGWGSRREAPPDPEGIAVIQRLYQARYRIQLSCGGWNPALVTPQYSRDRLAGMRRYLAAHSIPYDRIVAKDDVDIWFDDKVVGFTTWAAAELEIVARAGPAIPASSHPQIPVPQIGPAAQR